MPRLLSFPGVLCLFLFTVELGQSQEPAPKPVRLFAEAEDFTVKKGAWQVVPFRENYYASTFAVTFLSRMGCLSAPERVDAASPAIAEQKIDIPTDGDYFVMARYEQPYNFAVEFTVEVEQDGKVAYKKTYGRLEDPKIWAMNAHKRVPMERYAWGGTDNIVWQHFDATPLKKGSATLRLIAAAQMDGNKPRINAARRNVDVICLTNDTEGMKAQAKVRTYLELDGWLVQDGDLFIRLTNRGTAATIPTIAPNPGGQHSPYYVHIRDWPTTRVLAQGRLISPLKYANAGPRSSAVEKGLLAPELNPEQFKTVKAEEHGLKPGQQSGWVPMGQVLDALNNSIWTLSTKTPLDIEFAVPDGKGGLKSLRTLTIQGDTRFEMPGCVAPNPSMARAFERMGQPPVIRTVDEALTWLLGEVKKFPSKGKVPERFYIYSIGGFGSTPSHPVGRELIKALGDNTTLNPEGKKRNLVAHWRDPKPASIDANVARHGGGDINAGWKKLYIVSYGDEIHLPAVAPTHQEFVDFLDKRGVKLNAPARYTTDRNDPLYYYSQLCAKEKGGAQYAVGTAHYAKHGVLTGANYSPHANYLVTELDYIRPFKIGAMSMPWSEDYVWQIPEFSVQVIGYLTSAFRAGAKYHNNPIHMYVMPHSPGNTPASFRRSFYTVVAHGTKMVNYFCASPLATGGTENYVATNDLRMWRAIHDCTHEAGLFEDYVMDGKVRPARVGLLLSSVDDVMTGANNFAFAMHNNERKAIYYALRHSQVPVDFLSEDDVIDGLARDYSVIYVTQQWLHSRAVAALKKWAENGGTIIAHAGGGFLNEFNKPNPETGPLFGVKQQKLERDPSLLKYLLEENKPFLTKQDLPLYEPFDRVAWNTGKRELKDVPVIVWKQSLTVADGKVAATFGDGKPAVVEKTHGKGKAILIGFLPGQAYLKSGLPVRPVDRGSTDAAFAHFIPTAMNPAYRAAFTDDLHVNPIARPVMCSNTLVEATLIDTIKPLPRLAVPLINYAGGPLKELTVTISGIAAVKKIRSVERGELQPTFKDGSLIVTLPLDVADMLLIDR